MINCYSTSIWTLRGSRSMIEKYSDLRWNSNFVVIKPIYRFMFTSNSGKSISYRFRALSYVILYFYIINLWIIASVHINMSYWIIISILCNRFQISLSCQNKQVVSNWPILIIKIINVMFIWIIKHILIKHHMSRIFSIYTLSHAIVNCTISYNCRVSFRHCWEDLNSCFLTISLTHIF